MKGKVVAITGANAGIGFYTAKALLEKGAAIVMFCRNLEKAENAKQKLITDTGNDKVKTIQADMASFASIEKACKTFLSEYDKLDVLVNNAGVMRTQFALSEDGIEQTLAINHYAYFLMCYYLMPALKKAENARIVNVASRAHEGVEMDVDSLNEKSHFNFRKQYKLSKLANVLFTYKLAELLKDSSITVNCLDPGLVKTDLGKKAGSKLIAWAWSLFTLTGISPEKGAKTSVYLASSEEVENTTGKYFEECQACESSELTYDKQLQDALWEKTTRDTGKGRWGV
ncbi:MAG: SDR family oxidoreductase [Chitinophagales bacterium]